MGERWLQHDDRIIVALEWQYITYCVCRRSHAQSMFGYACKATAKIVGPRKRQRIRKRCMAFKLNTYDGCSTYPMPKGVRIATGSWPVDFFRQLRKEDVNGSIIGVGIGLNFEFDNIITSLNRITRWYQRAPVSPTCF